MKTFFKPLCGYLLAILSFYSVSGNAQTEQDALMMPENRLCVAGTFGYNSWTNYWEGTFKRNNDNIGRLSTKSAMVMLNYGVNKNLNLLASLPFVSTHASKGTLSGLNGFQDLGFFVKWRPVRIESGKQKFSVFAVGGFTAPTNKYNVDFMPMNIGMGCNVLSGRLIADVQINKIYASLSGAYLLRSNVTIDRDAYYTDHLINSDKVKMPNAGNLQVRTGYRSRFFIAEAFLDNMTTIGGFDIRKNDMPFISNKMNTTNTGLEMKYYLPKLSALGFHASVWHTIAGRNVGQATGMMAGVDYAFNLKRSIKK
ncbi:hypothetical protein [Rubrolithibacter danxiaensis]|uniref:hypothetical protein n=1 Tax=Rubrolithibacter danxiaensis TaxID=3390805 RepID=UPI003BF776E1